MQERILTPEQVAQILQVHQFTVLKFIKQGKLKASKLGRVYRIRQSDLEAFLDQTSGREPKAQEEPTNIIKKSKNKNKSSLKTEKPSDEANATLDPPIPEKKINGVEITTTKVKVIETEKTDKLGGTDEYYILQ